MTLIKRYYGIVILVLAIIIYSGFLLYQNNKLRSFVDAPQINDIYIFSDNRTYSPYLLDEIFGDSLYFFSHPYDFKESMPLLEQIEEDSFNDLIHYIYTRDELKKLVEEDKIVKIFR